MIEPDSLVAAQAAIDAGESLFTVADRLQWAPQRLWRALRRQDHFEEIVQQCAPRRTRKNDPKAGAISTVCSEPATAGTATPIVIGLRCKRVQLPAIRIMPRWKKCRRPKR